MKRYPHFRCPGGCGGYVCDPKTECAACQYEEPGPIESAIYRCCIRLLESFDRVKLLKILYIAFVIGIVFLVVRLSFGAVETHREVAAWRQIKG
jgi:hypothetical protein